MMTLIADALRGIMRHWVAGVSVVGTVQGEAQHGITVNTFTSVSLEPPLVLVCLFKETDAAVAILESTVFSVSILTTDQEHLSNRFAGFDPDYPRGSNLYEGLVTTTAITGAPILVGSLGWLDCQLWQVYDGSTHHIIVGEVVAAAEIDDNNPPQPLIYHNRVYRRFAPHEE